MMGASPVELENLRLELRKEDVTALKKRRSNLKRNATRTDKYLREQNTKSSKGLDTVSLEHHLEKLLRDLSMFELVHEELLNRLTEEEGELEEEDYIQQQEKMLGTRRGLTDLVSTSALHSRCANTRVTLDSYISRPKLNDDDVQPVLDYLRKELADMQASAVLLTSHPELLGLVQGMTKDFATLQIRRKEDMKDSYTSTPPTTETAPASTSKYDRLPRLQLPTFNGEPAAWRPFWEQFSNALSKDSTLTDVDRLAFLNMSLKGQEAKDIVESQTRGGPHYDAAVKALRDRYDQPRETCRTAIDNFSRHDMVLTAEGVQKTITMIQRTQAILKECSNYTVDTLFTIMVEMKMPDRLFQLWTEETATSSQPPTTEKLLAYLQRYRMRFCSRTAEVKKIPQSSNIKKHQSKPAILHQYSKDCTFCHNGVHPLYLCDSFKAKGVDERIATVSRLKVCQNCLSFKHFLRDCPSTRSCRDCGRRHHSLLHRTKQSSHAAEQTPEVPVRDSSHLVPTCSAMQGRPRVVLGTCSVIVESRGRRQFARALLDSGSHITFVTSRLTQALKAKKIRESTALTGISQAEVPNCRFKIDLFFVAEGKPKVPVQAVVIDVITGNLPGVQLHGVRDLPFLQGLHLADPNFDKPGNIDVLIGSDVIDEIMLPGRRSSADHTLHAWETIFGWSIRGKCIPESPSEEVHYCGHTSTADQSTDDLLSAFWKSEEPPNPQEPSDEEQQALHHFKKTHSRTEEGRYVVKLPKKDTSLTLGCSRGQAVRRYYFNKKSLEKKGQHEDFVKALTEYQELGHAEPVPLDDLRKPEAEVYYLPAHGVVKSLSTTTKLRVVFDASARTSSGAALNDLLLPGPNFYPLLTNIILLFRTHFIGMTADISKMFREVELHPSDRDLHRFLQPGSPGEGLRDMRMTRLTFGVTSSPFLATQVLRQVAIDYQSQFPKAASIVLNNFYVDDCLTGAETLEEAKEIRMELNDLLACACMLLRKWRSNSSELLETIPDEIKEKENVQLISPPTECHKALGIHWDTRSDTLHVATPLLVEENCPSKRKIASDVARTFDIMGWFAPSTIMIKVLLQRLWKLKLDWDEPVPEDVALVWRNWRKELELITKHPIQRFHREPGKTVRNQQLHGFSDASDTAYAGVVYLRVLYTDATVSTSLLIAKTKVAPLGGSTTPRLELAGAHLLSKLLHTVANLLSISPSDVYAWSDSTITLNWLNNPPSRGFIYERNRARETVQRLPATHWRHVPTSSNPADVASRGITPKQLIKFKLWWKGPTWLLLTPSEWPNFTDWKSKKLSLNSPVFIVPPSLVDLTEAFSSYFNLKRILSWCLRFIGNCRLTPDARCFSSKLSLDELRKTEEALLKLSQSRTFKSEREALTATGTVPRQSNIIHLRPYLDEKGLIRVGGRLEKATVAQEQKHPIILHHSDRMAKLICTQIHVDNLHVGPTTLLAIMSLKYHVIGFKHLTKGVSRACVRCRKVYARTASQLMGQLPACRVTPTSTFHHTGIDFAGPIMVKRGNTRARTLVKTYICVFICMATKAVHLEVVRDLSTVGFLSALRCFVARRGYPATLMTDNGSNFIGAKKALEGFFALLNTSDTQTSLDHFCTTYNIQWTHTPARSPHYGGLWEAAVKSMKLLLTKVVGPHNLFMDELYSITVEVEAALNSRPLIPLDSAPSDGVEVLTPGHFLVGKALKAIPTADLSNRKLNCLTRWNLRQRLSSDLWERWSKEYINSLQTYRKWRHPQRSVQVGDVVLIKDSDLFVRSWPLARVIAVHPGADGLVRVATVRTEKGTFRRAVQKLVPLLEEHSSTSLAPEDVRVSTPPTGTTA